MFLKQQKHVARKLGVQKMTAITIIRVKASRQRAEKVTVRVKRSAWRQFLVA